MNSVHVPVLLRELLRGLELTPGLTVIDGTVGGGGHSREILPRILPGGRLLAVDRDPMMLQLAAQGVSGPEVAFRQASYCEMPAALAELGWSPADRILVDLGLSSDQLADETRSFSFQSPGELDLRFDRRGRSAAELLAAGSAEDLEAIFREFGEEPQGRRIAEHLVRSRQAVADPHRRRTGASRRRRSRRAAARRRQAPGDPRFQAPHRRQRRIESSSQGY